MSQTTKSPIRRLRPSADTTRQSILTGALDLFSELSFDGATTREIAARAGVTQGLLNYHFSSKDDLWRSAVDGCSELSEALDSRAEGRGEWTRYRAKLMIREFITSRRRTAAARIITKECKNDGTPGLDVERHIRRVSATTALFSRWSRRHVLTYRWRISYILTGTGRRCSSSPLVPRLSGIDPLAPT